MVMDTVLFTLAFATLTALIDLAVVVVVFQLLRMASSRSIGTYKMVLVKNVSIFCN